MKNFRHLAAAAAVVGLLATAGAAQAAWRPLAFPVQDATLRAVTTDGAGRILIGGSKGTVAESRDGGRSWRLAVLPDGAALDFRGVALTGPRSAVAMSAGEAEAGRARLYVTGDGGASWRLAHETRRAGAFLDAVAFWDRRNGMAFSDPVAGQWLLLRTSDGGRSWREQPAAFPPLRPGEAAFAASNSALFLGPRGQAWIASGGTASGRVFRSRDRGATWQVAETPIPGGATGGVFGGLALDADHAVVVGGDHKDELRPGPGIAVTANGGSAWTAATGVEASGLLESVGRLGARTLLAVGPRGTWISRDRGRTWTRADAEAYHAVACAGGHCVAVGAAGRVGVWAP